MQHGSHTPPAYQPELRVENESRGVQKSGRIQGKHARLQSSTRPVGGASPSIHLSSSTGSRIYGLPAAKSADSLQMQSGVRATAARRTGLRVCAYFGIHQINNAFQRSRGFKALQIWMAANHHLLLSSKTPCQRAPPPAKSCKRGEEAVLVEPGLRSDRHAVATGFHLLINIRVNPISLYLFIFIYSH